MARLGSGKQTPRKCVFLLSCVVFLAIVLLADFLWVSSSSSPSGISPPSSFSYWPTSFDLSLGLSTPKAKQVQYGDVYMLDEGNKWKQLPPMPLPNSHIEFAWVLVNNSIIVVGGTTMKHPITKKMILVGEVFRFNLDSLKWSVLGRMPFRIKTTLAAFWNGWLYFTSGQRDRGPHDPSPRKVVGSMYRTKLSLT
ncbi:hypothetical protein BHE74_00004441 [Ensete ventricosum]|nr:hypothetical protein BHE74_00004441 [Ensete ventricosum]